jgi:hypothetical protein
MLVQKFGHALPQGRTDSLPRLAPVGRAGNYDGPVADVRGVAGVIVLLVCYGAWVPARIGTSTNR